MYLYMQVTKDEYELPRAVAGSVQELADMTNENKRRIIQICANKRITGHRTEFVRVEVDEDE